MPIAVPPVPLVEQSLSRREWYSLIVGVGLLLALRLPFLAPTLEDIDSVNFDLGVHDYDPTLHRPHPPGYPVYVGIAKLSHAVIESHAMTLAAMAAVFGSAALIPGYLLFRELVSRRVAALACLFAFFNPLMWFTSVRPLSDPVGLFAATLAQCLALRGLSSGRYYWYLSALMAGLSGGIRIQTLFLTGPLLLYGCVRRPRQTAPTLVAFGVGVLLWLAPLVTVLGGFDALSDSFFPVFRDTLTFESLVSGWSLRRAAQAVVDVLIVPWNSVALAGLMLLLSAWGGVLVARNDRRALALTTTLFVPYGAYHVLIQDTGTVRYDLPLIPLIALLAAIPVAAHLRCSARAWVAASVAFVIVAARLTVPALIDYHTTPSPAAQAISHIRDAASGERLVATGHYIFDRYLPLLPAEIERISPEPEQEWEGLSAYWASGRREPVLFMAQRRRRTLTFFGRDTQARVGCWRWPVSVHGLLKGARPGAVELVRLEPPRWTTERGFLAMYEGSRGQMRGVNHRLRVRASQHRRIFVVSGATVDRRSPVTLSLFVGSQQVASAIADGEFSFRAVLPPTGSHGYVPVRLRASAPVAMNDVWIDRDTRAMIRPGPGFYFFEYDERDTRFRWIGPEAHAVVYLPGASGEARISGQVPDTLVAEGLQIRVAWDGRALGMANMAGTTFEFHGRIERPLAEPWGELTITSSRSFVPDTHSGNGDKRELSARVYELSLTGPEVSSSISPTQERCRD